MIMALFVSWPAYFECSFRNIPIGRTTVRAPFGAARNAPDPYVTAPQASTDHGFRNAHVP